MNTFGQTLTSYAALVERQGADQDLTPEERKLFVSWLKVAANGAGVSTVSAQDARGTLILATTEADRRNVREDFFSYLCRTYNTPEQAGVSWAQWDAVASLVLSTISNV